MSESESELEPKTNPNRKKNIFKYFNGIEDVFADPFEIDWRMQDALKLVPTPTVDEMDRRLNVPVDDDGKFDETVTDKDKALYMDALHFYIPYATKVFELKPFDKKTGEGMTGDEILDVWASYIKFQADLKKNTE